MKECEKKFAVHTNKSLKLENVLIRHKLKLKKRTGGARSV